MRFFRKLSFATTAYNGQIAYQIKDVPKMLNTTLWNLFPPQSETK